MGVAVLDYSALNFRIARSDKIKVLNGFMLICLDDFCRDLKCGNKLFMRIKQRVSCF